MKAGLFILSSIVLIDEAYDVVVETATGKGVTWACAPISGARSRALQSCNSDRICAQNSNTVRFESTMKVPAKCMPRSCRELMLVSLFWASLHQHLGQTQMIVLSSSPRNGNTTAENPDATEATDDVHYRNFMLHGDVMLMPHHSLDDYPRFP